MTFSPIHVRGQALAGGRLPAVCAPLVARDHEALVAQARHAAALRPDLLEWRIDFFAAFAERDEVLAAARALRAAAGDLPILLTRRSVREGGQTIELAEFEVVAMYEALAEAGLVDLLDWEMEGAAAELEQVQVIAYRHQLPLVLSFHDFQRTPDAAHLLARLRKAAALGADVAKIAVMPQRMEDVHAVLGATLAASRELRIPVVSMAMGALGAVSRVCGGAFGSALTFAVAGEASAPGQMPIEDVRAVLAALSRASAG